MKKIITLLLFFYTSITISFSQINGAELIPCPGTTRTYCADLFSDAFIESLVQVETIWNIQGGTIVSITTETGEVFGAGGTTSSTFFDTDFGGLVAVCIEVEWDGPGSIDLRQIVTPYHYELVEGTDIVIPVIEPENTLTFFYDLFSVNMTALRTDGIISDEIVVICSTPETVSFSGDEGNSHSVQWTSLSSFVSCISGCNTPNAEFRVSAGATGEHLVEFTASRCNGQISSSFTGTIFVGPPTLTDIVMPLEYDEHGCLHPLTSYYICTDASPGSNITWNVPSCPPSSYPRCWTVDSTPGNTECVNIITGDVGGRISVTATNACGTATKRIYIKICSEDEGSGENTNPHLAGRSRSDSDITETTVFPNPTSDIISVDYESSTDLLKEIKIYNTLGQEVYTQTIDNSKSSDIININAELLPSGQYMIQGISDSKVLFVESFSKL